MTTEAEAELAAEHPRIWLEPAGNDEHDEGRTWCQDNVWGEGAVEYVRADLVASPAPATAEVVREHLMNALRSLSVPEHKMTDTEFLRASTIIGKDFVNAALEALAHPVPPVAGEEASND